MGLVLELTHRCPLRCPYCSNPLDLVRASEELDEAAWHRVLDEAVALGVLQLHFSGGEPMARPDLPALVRHAATSGLYSNLITSGVLLDAPRLDILLEAGLDHVQLSFQGAEAADAERVGGLAGAQAKKLEAARLVRAAGLPLTVNFVIHRQNARHVPAMIRLAAELGAGRVEIAHTQYYGWGLRNRDALLPDVADLQAATEAVEEGRRLWGHALTIDYVTPDYHANQPKPCMDGWARRFMVITPAGRALPCHAAETIRTLSFPDVREASLASIWADDPAFARFRGTAWMPEPCRGCDRREIDWGGCRCQALALAGDAGATDPVCERSPHHAGLRDLVAGRSALPPEFQYRGTAAPSPVIARNET